MSFYRFGPNDLFYNRIEAYPEVSFHIYDRRIIYNNRGITVGKKVTNVTTTSSLDLGYIPSGTFLSLYELNVDRPSGQTIYPFITKEGSLTSFRTVSLNSFNSDFVYGDRITSSYPLSASISSDYISTAGRAKITALRNRLNSYQNLSYAYAYSSSFGDKSTQTLRLISIPSIFYGSSIKKGSVSLKFYVSGTVVGELKDDKRNGELKQVASSSDGATVTPSGSVAGVVLYNEGFIILTGSWPLSPHTENYLCPDDSTADQPRWTHFGHTGSIESTSGCSYINLPSSSYSMIFSGTNYIPTVTMMAHAPKGELNHSNNPTFIKYGNTMNYSASAGAKQFVESYNNPIANVVSSSLSGTNASFEKTTFINQVGIYDENKNLIAIAKMANPIRKRENDDYTFKLKLDF